MTICEVYVGDLKDPAFKWEGGNWNGNIPARLSPLFPPLPGNYTRAVDTWVNSTGVESRQTDFGGRVARVTKLQLLEFMAASYFSEDSPEAQAAVHALTRFINTLDEDRHYALVTTEW